jgi:hypothetical protein
MNDKVNTPEVDENKEFLAIANAMAAGTSTDLDRLMAADGTEKPDKKEESEEKDESADPKVADDTETDTEGTDPKGDEDSTEASATDDETKEAATTAASTVNPNADVEEMKRELHKLRSEVGRVPFLQRRLAEMEREDRANKARTFDDSTPGTGKKPTPAELKDVVLDEETQQQIDDLKEIDPVIAKTLERIAKAAVFSSQQHVNHAVTSLTDSEREAEDYRFVMEQKAQLLEVIPQADAVFASPEWKQWKDSLTPGRRAIAESSYAVEVEQAIRAFAADMQKLNGTTAPNTTQVTTQVTPENKEVIEARARKMKDSVPVKSSAAKAVSVLDEDAYFKEQYEKVMKANHLS